MNKRKGKLEDRAEAQSLLKRIKYANIKADPELYEKEREKEKLKYKIKKEKKQVVPINEKSPRECRAQRKKWREAAKKYRQKKKEEIKKAKELPKPVFIECKESEEIIENNKTGGADVTNDDILIQEPTLKSLFAKKIRRIRFIEKQKRMRLHKIILQLKKENRILKRKCHREQQKKQLSVSIGRVKKSKTIKERKKKEYRRNNDNVIKMVKTFFLDDSNSTLAAGKKEYITRNKEQKQKRYLNASLKVLFSKFIANSPVKVSYGFFCKHRPFWTLLGGNKKRETCMCMPHCNMDLLVDSLHKASIIEPKNSEELLAKLCCEAQSEKCLARKCEHCKFKEVTACGEFRNDQILTYHQWIRCRETITNKKGTKNHTITTKIEKTGSPLEILEELNKQLPFFLEHCYKRYTQHANMKTLKENLKVNECVMHIDFSENYGLKFGTEVQSFHFGGSRKEVSIHTGVIYTFDCQTSSVGTTCTATLSKCLRHDAPAIWAHIIPLIKIATDENPFIDTVHFQSDSPTSQYRNKYIFYMISQIWKDFPRVKTITWNYTESGHGKGAPDGVGAVLKRTADSLVKFGNDIGTFEAFIESVQQHIQNVKILQVDEESIKEKERQLPSDLKPFSGTLSVHQVLWERYTNHLAFRKTSCFECEVGNICEHGKHLGYQKIVQSVADSQHQLDDNDVVTLECTRKNTLSDITNKSPTPSTSRIAKITGKQVKNVILSKKKIVEIKVSKSSAL